MASRSQVVLQQRRGTGPPSTGKSLNEYVVRHAVEAAETDLADRRVFAVDDAAWSEFEALLSRPPTHKPRLAKLLTNPSVLEPPES